MPTTFDDEFETCTRRAWHLELRDTYEGYQHDDDQFARWRAAGHPTPDPVELRTYMSEWMDTVKGMIARGVDVRRLRVVSEPVTDYIQWEHRLAPYNLEAGERLRWLPRAQASDLLFPGNDLWLFDDTQVRFGIFAGNGAFLRGEHSTQHDVIDRVAASFEAAWARGIDHEDYKLT